MLEQFVCMCVGELLAFRCCSKASVKLFESFTFVLGFILEFFAKNKQK